LTISELKFTPHLLHSESPRWHCAQNPATPAEGIAEAYAPRRTVLDKILVEAAVSAGAELREKFSVEELN